MPPLIRRISRIRSTSSVADRSRRNIVRRDKGGCCLHYRTCGVRYNEQHNEYGEQAQQ